MATLYANSTGNWTAAIWYDIATGQPYANTYPQVGDYVYLNGKTITANVNINIGSGTITNRANSDYGIVSGGQVNTSVNERTITANIEAYPYSNVINGTHQYTYSGNIYSYIPTSTSNYPLYLRLDSTSTTLTLNNANLYGMIPNALAQGLRIQNNTVTNGNNNLNLVNTNCDSIAIQNFSNTPTASHVFTIEQNGNMINCTIRQYGTIDYTINGILKQEDRIILSSINNLQVTGEYYNLTNTIQSITSFVIAGNVHYIKDFGGFSANTISYLTPMTTQFINEGTSPFQIVNSNTGIDYPPEGAVKIGTEYAWGEKVGTYLPDYPPESVVLQGYEYDNGNKTGDMSASAQVGCVTKGDVREGVALIGMGEVGTLVVPSVDDVREGVVFDNGSVGTLIVQGGGDRLRIADFGYYTNAQSDTYIVDLTEQDKPKFAVAEERVLIEMFPDLDLENIPDKYFDDLFVKYLKYRLIVEYYRTAGINSTFTPSEPTTEIVNYQNVRNEVWLNSANIYLKAWGKKYPESIMKPQRILL